MPIIELSLTIMSENLAPEVITSLVGCSPTSSQTKGHRRTSLAPPFARNSWTLEFGESSDVEIDRLKERCLRFVSRYHTSLKEITAREGVMAFLTFYIRTGVHHTGFELSVDEMQLLAAARIFTTFSIYPID
jgi:hypothetical protein